MNIAGPRVPNANSLAIGVAVIGILVVTLSSSGDGPGAAFSFAFDLGRRGVGDAILNILLFVPLGIVIAWGGRPIIVAGVSALVLASLVEIAQTVLPGRDPALSDIILNTAGAVAGAVVARRRRVLSSPDRTASLVLTAASLAFVAATMGGTAYVLSPVRGSPTRAERQLRLPSSPGEGAADMRSVMTVEVPLAQEPVLIARSGDDLLLRYPSRGAALGFDQPEYWKTGAFAGKDAGHPSSVYLSRDRSRWDITIGADRTRLGPTIGQGWTALAYPDAIGRRWGGVVSALWLFAMFLPIGFWARGRLRLMVGVVSLLLLIFMPAITGVVASTLLEWAGAVTGFVAGTVIGLSFPKRFSQAPSRTD